VWTSDPEQRAYNMPSMAADPANGNVYTVWTANDPMGTWDVFFWVRDARALHAELLANGADIVYGPIVQEEYQMEEFAVRDREGYVLGFGQPLAAKR